MWTFHPAILRRVPLGVLLVLALACQTPAERFTERAVHLGMQREVVAGTEFRHVVLRTNRPARAPQPLHVYLDHDGTPWLGGEPSADPTPRNDLTLRLMAVDPAPALYLGRPCHVGLMHEPGCDTAVWTSARYSERVVESMAAALRHIVSRRESPPIVLFGYSGGGALAMLLAPRVPQTVAVVTVAANLDIDAWADHHRWPRLHGSQNPAAVRLPAGVFRRHYAGGHDRIVPAYLVQRAAPPGDEVVVVPDHDHVCCWESLWPRILTDLTTALERRR